ncbi:1581_t:CDS:1, partial [Paraglomus occultum]
MINKLDELPIELKVKIASHLETLYPLGCCSRDWYNIVNSSNAKYKWLLNKYGCIHALFHAVRIGYPLLDCGVTEALLKYSHISRYFVQCLKLGYGKHGYWGNNISNDVYETIINFEERYRNDDRNDILLIRQALKGIGNEDSIITIIESYGFIPFPPNPISTTYIFERPAAEYEDALPKNGYTSVSGSMIVARAIIIYPNLLNVWKKMGYHKITDDLENSVVQLTLLDLYSTEVPPVRTVAETLSSLQLIGFPLTDIVIGNVILLFKWRLADVGDSLIEGFSTARELSKTDIRE